VRDLGLRASAGPQGGYLLTEHVPKRMRRSCVIHGRSGPKPRAVTNFSRAMSTATKNANGRQIREWQLIRRSGSDPSRLARSYQHVPSAQHQPVRL